ncbi:hypothetical protein BIPXVNHO_CDS0101 [Staphylococcus phage PG-2021_27]
MTNTIKEFLEGKESYTVEDLANHGLMSGVIGELISNYDIVKFFDNYEQDIENEMMELADMDLGIETYDPLTDYELIEELRSDMLDFDSEEEKTEVIMELAGEQVREDYHDEIENEEMTEDEVDELVMDYMADIEPKISDNDKIQWVKLATEYVAQKMVLESEEE